MADELLPYLLNRLTARINQAWVKKLREHGLTIGRWQILSVLSRFDGCRIGTIADLAGTEQPATSRVIDQMERDELVIRRPAADDSRAVEVWLTPAGRKIFDDLLPVADEFVGHLTKNMSKDDVKFMTRHLEKLIGELQEL